MPVFEKKHFLSDLIDRTELVSSNTRAFQRLPHADIMRKPAVDQWSIAEVFEHLNLTYQYYLKLFLTKISKAPDKITPYCKTGLLGDFLYEKIRPRPDGSLYKLRASKSLWPQGQQNLGMEVLDQFLQQQDSIDDILHHVSTKDMDHLRIPLHFSSLVRLNLGDCLRSLVAHNERHILQAQKILETTG